MFTMKHNIPQPQNEPVYSYAPGTPERKALKEEIQRLRNQVVEIPQIINGKEIFTGNKVEIRPPHDLNHLLGYYHKGDKEHVREAINAAMLAREHWINMPWEQRLAIFQKAAELLSKKHRYWINAATMLGQSKNAFQAEIDAACELIDFWRFNTYWAQWLYEQQPISPEGFSNYMDYRPLDGFVFAVTPFNFTSIGGNLPTAPAIMGNTVVWKPARQQVYSAYVIMKVLEEAGLPPGVINMIIVDGPVAGEVVFNDPDFAGLHFTGSTSTFQWMWDKIGSNIKNYKAYPRIVGETGGKDFVVMHPSADLKATVANLIRGAFEYQGQKCSAASRAYIPESRWKEFKDLFVAELETIKVGPVEDFRNFMNAVIDKSAFNKIVAYIEKAKKDGQEFIFGGGYSDKDGYYIEPTVIRVHNPSYVTMCEEIFGPVLSIYVYKDKEFEDIMEIVDRTSLYGLTGSIFAQDREAVQKALHKLRFAAGNFYINDKPTGAIVAQQPFGGSRQSGTNDKAGWWLNLLRWTSVRSVKETFVPVTDYRYPFMEEE
ncbi:MAG: L-glutamate gamma-semialdehyde dehydrogenase [Chlorobi bacterium]|nr:L-glutamate gamma-semialdehyde dehydrogenase [Chlorobiota bacterium]